MPTNRFRRRIARGWGRKNRMAIAEKTDARRLGRALLEHGIGGDGERHWHPSVSHLYTHALERGEGRLAEGGALAVDTGVHTGRSPKDKFVVREPGSEDRIWWGDVNAELEEESFERLRGKVLAHLDEGDVYVV